MQLESLKVLLRFSYKNMRGKLGSLFAFGSTVGSVTAPQHLSSLFTFRNHDADDDDKAP